jgi:hypothetical protein
MLNSAEIFEAWCSTAGEDYEDVTVLKGSPFPGTPQIVTCVLDPSIELAGVVDFEIEWVMALFFIDRSRQVAYRWIDPSLVRAYITACEHAHISPSATWDGLQYADIEAEGIFDRFHSYVTTGFYEKRLSLDLDLS